MSTTDVTPPQTPAPTDPRLAALQAQTAILAQQQQQMDATLKIQQSQQGMLTGMLPTSSAAPMSGAITPTGSNPFDSQKLAYDVLAAVATTVAEKVDASGPVFIYDQNEINSLLNYKAVLQILTALQNQVAHLKQTFNKDLRPEISALMAQPQPAAPQASPQAETANRPHSDTRPAYRRHEDAKRSDGNVPYQYEHRFQQLHGGRCGFDGRCCQCLDRQPQNRIRTRRNAHRGHR